MRSLSFLTFIFRNSLNETEGIYVSTSADDCTILTLGTKSDNMCSKVNNFLHDLYHFFTLRSPTLSPAKSAATNLVAWV